MLPKPLFEFLRSHRRQYLEKQFFNQGVTQIKCGAFTIEAPQNHILLKLVNSQPYRDLCAGITAKYVSAKYPDGTIIDIGANIGDTAAIIATYAKNKLMLIEASDYFFEFLVRNTSQFPNDIVTKKMLISDGGKARGTFNHWGGTASFNESVDGAVLMKTERLSHVAGENTCFIKTDTDGYDVKILLDSLDWLALSRPAILFENQIGNIRDLTRADELYSRLMQNGYKYFIVWDDPGFHLVSTTSLNVLRDLNRYLFKVTHNNGHKSIYNYDVLCLHKNDSDIYKLICEWYTTY